MSNLMAWNLIIGFLLPNLIAVLQQPTFNKNLRVAVTAGVSILGGVGTAYFNDQFNVEDVVGSILTTAVAAITFYKGWWKPTQIAPAIESATSKTPKHRVEEGAVDSVRLVIIVFLVLAVLAALFLLL